VTLFVGVLGPLVLRYEDRELASPNSAKACALVAYLAAGAPRMFPRADLAQLLWPDQPSVPARHSLAVALNLLRIALGPAAECLAASHTRLGVRHVTTDLRQLEELAPSTDLKDLRRAADLIRGPLLVDTNAGTAEFEDWLRPEAARVLALETSVLSRLVAAEEASGEFNAAVRHATRLVTSEPLSDAWQRLLIGALARANLRSEAIAQYHRFAELLWNELSVEPEEATRDLARDIARGEFAAHTAGGAANEEKNGPAADWRLGAAMGVRPARVSWPALLPRLSVAVAPLLNHVGDTRAQHLVDGFGDDLVTDLLNRGRGLSPVSVIEARLPTLGGGAEFLSADYLITGGAQRAGEGNIRFNVRIQKAGSREFCWSRRYECKVEELPERQTEITRRLASVLNFLLIREASRRAIEDPLDGLDAASCVARGTAAIIDRNSPDVVTEAHRWYLRALAIDPKNVEALAGFALACQQVVGQPWWADEAAIHAALNVGRAAVSAALGLVPGHPLANGVSGMLASAAGELERAGRAFERAIAADERYAGARSFSGYNAAFLGRADETIPAIEAAMKLDRTDRATSIMKFFGGFAHLLLGRHDEAVTWLSQSRERNTGYGSALLFYAVALAFNGQAKEAAKVFAEFVARYPGYTLRTFERQWLSRSAIADYQQQIVPLFDQIRILGLPH
jgi:DNA-binding SARP family transcriptional activator/TolB-like protein